MKMATGYLSRFTRELKCRVRACVGLRVVSRKVRAASADPGSKDRLMPNIKPQPTVIMERIALYFSTLLKKRVAISYELKPVLMSQMTRKTRDSAKRYRAHPVSKKRHKYSLSMSIIARHQSRSKRKTRPLSRKRARILPRKVRSLDFLH